MPLPIVEYLHLLLAFVFVAAVMAAHWNTIAARRTASWAERAVLFELNRRLSVVFSLPALIGTGVAGNVLAMMLGYRMSDTRLLQVVTALWLLIVIVALALDVPLSARLATLARTAANAGTSAEPVEWAGALRRWRTGSLVQLVLFLALLWFMVAAWRQ